MWKIGSILTYDYVYIYFFIYIKMSWHSRWLQNLLFYLLILYFHYCIVYLLNSREIRIIRIVSRSKFECLIMMKSEFMILITRCTYQNGCIILNINRINSTVSTPRNCVLHKKSNFIPEVFTSAEKQFRSLVHVLSV